MIGPRVCTSVVLEEPVEPLARKYAAAHGIPIPEGGLRIESGIPWPLLAVIVVTIIITFIATRRRFGRYVFAIGGNPEAAELAGIYTRWTIMKTHILIGLLCGLSAAIAAARLNGSTPDVGSATSCTSSRRRSSAVHRSPAASGRSRVRCSAPWSCSRWRSG